MGHSTSYLSTIPRTLRIRIHIFIGGSRIMILNPLRAVNARLSKEDYMGRNSSAGHPDPDNYDDDEHHDFEVYYGDIDPSDEDETEKPSTDDDIPNPEDFQDEIAEDEDPNFYWDSEDDGSVPDRNDD
jgi:hypothetical protein